MLHIVIGGSAGSFQSITQILAALPKTYPYPVFLCLHRLKHVRNGFVEALSIKSKLPVLEPKDKQEFLPGNVYLAPANYHMYLEFGNTFALTTEEVINHSRPSIDLTFMSAAYTLKNKVLGILLSGANKDGALGLKAIKDAGGKVIVQSPEECQVKTMTTAAIKATSVDHILYTQQIIDYLLRLKE